MSGLAETIQYVSAKETERYETALAATLQPLRDEFSAWASAHAPSAELNPPSLQSFTQFCLAHSVPHLPAKPATLAAFILAQIESGVKPELIRSIVSAVETLHDRNLCANPSAHSLVRFALDKLKPVSPPRSWTGEEQALFVALPPEIQSVISRREANREKDLRNKQNQLAEEIKKAKRHTQTEPVEKSVETKTELENTNG